MPLLINLRHLEKKEVTLEGEMTPAELDLEKLDEVIHVSKPLQYDLVAERIDNAILVQGSLFLDVECECVRCLKKFRQEIDIPQWAAHLPLEGEDQVVVSNDTVDLTPYIREDIVLGFPQHPLCDAECVGLPKGAAAKVKKASGAGKFDESSSAWAQLDKLKLK
jgi:uncharacterized metal-binding protein YceD (DUF177 family)